MKITLVKKDSINVEFEDVEEFHPNVEGYLHIQDNQSAIYIPRENFDWFIVDVIQDPIDA